MEEKNTNQVLTAADSTVASAAPATAEDAPKKRGRKPKVSPVATLPPVEEQLTEELAADSGRAPTLAEEQEQALRQQLEGKNYTREDFRNSRNYLVEAGAGAGKTYIMVQRIVNQLVSGYCQPEDIVAITFTNKSTLEMKERLDKFLKERRDALKEKPVLTDEEQALADRLEELLRKTGRMQVSTIHSFCQTMLEAMPFNSKLGLDMQVLEDDEAFAKAFWDRKWRERQRPFEIPRQLGVKPNLLEKTFMACRKNNEAVLGYTDVNSPDAVQWKSDLKDAVHNLQRDLHTMTPVPRELRKELRDIMAMTPADFARDLFAIRTLIWLSLTNEKNCPLDYDLTGREAKQAFRESAEGQRADGIWTGPGTWGDQLRKAGRPLIHSYIMRDLEVLLREYREEKVARHIATYDDLLLRTRDMLRESKEARTYFHDRYKVVYVDEMQDTDPVQTELLFYLTTDEAYFDADDWKKCRPVPGSLFLVGDPKQAIYRFRGADISVYNDLLELFRSGEELASGVDAVGEKVTLQFNFRSSTNICDLATQVFQPDSGTQDQEAHTFTGGKYHAEYVAMNARSGDCPRGRMMYYEPASVNPKGKDAERVAAFIYQMIQTKRYVGIHRPDKDNPQKGKHAHPAREEDFLILTKEKGEAQAYADALRAYGIAAEVSGEKKIGDTVPIARAVLHLESLLALRDDHKLLLVLRECYGLKDEWLRVFLQRAGEKSLTGAANLKKLKAIQLALAQEPTLDVPLLAVCIALEEIAKLRKLARSQSAMSVIELLLEGGYGVWAGEAECDRQHRCHTWAEVQQYLNLVRSGPQRSFRALAAYAVELAQKEFEHELGLTSAEKAVRIMNLHKAKGLEGEVVILACGWQDHFPITRHVERSGPAATEYRCLFDGFPRAGRLIACPKDWEKQAEEEQRYLDAEYARLLYVAATRAKTMLLVCAKDFKQTDQDPDDAEEKRTYWDPLKAGLTKLNAEDPYYKESFKQLQRKSAKAPKTDPSTLSAAVTVDPAAMEASLEELGAELAKNTSYAITPSKLEKHARGVIVRRDPDGEENSVAEQDAAVAAPEEEHEDVLPEAVAPAATEERAHTGPFGPAWGTMVHRVMELAVRENRYENSILQASARQAVHELLTEGDLDRSQRWMLGLAPEDADEAVVARLVPQIVQAAGFLTDEQSALRQMLAGASAYPELPFILQAKPDDQEQAELYRHLSKHISSEVAKQRTLAVEGIIDLAIWKDDSWYVVDYKTDKVLQGETEEDFSQRLREEYTPQITAYARVLEKMGGQKPMPVKGAWLCSIPLGGRLIKLDITPGADA